MTNILIHLKFSWQTWFILDYLLPVIFLTWICKGLNICMVVMLSKITVIATFVCLRKIKQHLSLWKVIYINEEKFTRFLMITLTKQLNGDWDWESVIVWSYLLMHQFLHSFGKGNCDWITMVSSGNTSIINYMTVPSDNS